MVSDWEQTTVGELVARGVLERPLDGNHGSIHPKGSDFVKSGVPFIMASDLVNGGVDTVGCSFISLDQAHRLRKGFARRGDVLLSHKATLGRTAVVGEIPGEFVVLTPQVTYYRAKDADRLVNRYLKYYFDSRMFQQVLHSWAGAGSTRAYIGITDQLRLPIVLPPPAHQRAIARLLGDLDDKIELNRRMSEALESATRALFTSWFVNFDPTRAKAEGRAPGLPQRVEDLFASAFDESALGEAPRGWLSQPLAAAALQIRDVLNPGQEPSEMFSHFSLPAFDAGQTPVREAGHSIKSNKWQVPAGAVLFSKLNPVETERVWLVDVANGDRAISSTEFVVLVPKAPYSRSFVYCLARSQRFREGVASLVTGTSNSHQRANTESLLGLTFVAPPETLLSTFDRVAEPLLQRALLARRESRSLAETRDALLPRLVSGELRLSAAVEPGGAV